MTNSEYFEKNKISFAEAMEIFNKQKDEGIKSFDKFLASDHVEHKFKVGDIIVLQLNEETRDDNWKHNVVFEVITADEKDTFLYELKALTPDTVGTTKIEVGYVDQWTKEFVEDHCILY